MPNHNAPPIAANDSLQLLFYPRCLPCSRSGPINLSGGVKKNSAPVSIKNVYPNPFKDNIGVDFSVEKAAILTFSILDINGRIITEDQASYQPGEYDFVFDHSTCCSTINSGIYLLRIAGDNFEICKKVVKTE